MVENFGECYHCGPTHPEYCSVMAHALPDTHRVKKQVDAFAKLTARWEGKAKMLGNLAGGYTAGRMYPLNYFIASCDHAVIPRFTPLASQRTQVEMIWLVREDAVENQDYDLEKLTWLWKVTTDQDKKIVDDNQAGVNSLAYRSGPYSMTEQGLTWFTTWYLRQIEQSGNR